MIFEDLNCLSKCKVLEPDCFSLLYTDYYNAGGVCAGSYADVVHGWPVSSQTCQMEDVSSTWNWVQEGLCRPETEKALIQHKCVRRINDVAPDGLNDGELTLLYMMASLCRPAVFDAFPWDTDYPPFCVWTNVYAIISFYYIFDWD